ncbi:unnamed protein product [Sphenostylis stenocarpa]|uniref:ZZ-type domain-containing protein n=1 Tax=Sphenostylis stenocarpa TaxID=92480 RepID=A0AA86SSJ7_9FABA|nr:unnamed protein product [Sphenostylis stenocarpa]
MGFFSPQFNGHTCGSQVVSGDLGRSPCCTTSLESFECREESGSATLKGDEGTTINSKYTSTRTLEVIRTPDEGKMLPQNEHNQKRKILIADVSCTSCKQLLFHPVVLNCGHVCQSPHPRSLPKVSLALDHFLEEQFPEEYAQRRDEIQLDQTKVKPKVQTASCSLLNGGDMIAWLSDPRYKVHVGIGCDFCGMFPITGDRYKCLDCKEEVGFDLCGDCYKTQARLPGRFNQQHGPEHRFELLRLQNPVVRRQQDDQEPPENFLPLKYGLKFAPQTQDQIADLDLSGWCAFIRTWKPLKLVTDTHHNCYD